MTDHLTITILDDYQGVALGLGPWERLGDAEVHVLRDHVDAEEALIKALADTDVVVAMRERTPFPATVLSRLPRLRLLVTTGGINATIDLDAARAAGITVCGTRSLANSATTVELAWGLILATARHICGENQNMREGGWQFTLGTELRGQTLGIVGLGRIGQQVASIAQAFGMEVLAWSQHLTQAAAADAGARAVDKERMFSSADVISLHLKLSDRTWHVVGRAELDRMKRSAILVNTARAGLVDTAALVDVLAARGIAGAGLDVYDTEPLPVDDPLRSLSNVVLTPHLGYVTRGGYELYFADAVEDIEAFRAGSPVRTLT